MHFNESLHEVVEDDAEEPDDDEDEEHEVQSATPEDYKDEDRLFHLNFLRNHAKVQQSAYPKMYRISVQTLPYC